MGGAVAGIVGSVAAPIVSNLAGGLVNKLSDSIGGLVGKHGPNLINAALGNIAGGSVGKAVIGVIKQSPLPNFMQNTIINMVNQAVSQNQNNSVGHECQCEVDSAVGDKMDNFADKLQDLILKMVEESMGEETKKGGKEGSGGSSHWLVALAKGMSKIQAHHLNKMMAAQDTMQANSGDKAEDRTKFTEAQAEFQAQSKLFSMASESASTVIKTVGDGLASLARKQ